MSDLFNPRRENSKKRMPNRQRGIEHGESGLRRRLAGQSASGSASISQDLKAIKFVDIRRR